MGIVIGIDKGIGSTKVAALQKERDMLPFAVQQYSRSMPVVHVLNAFMSANKISLTDVERLMLTGVGNRSQEKIPFGLPGSYVSEFQCNGVGAGYLTDLTEYIVVSMGTGTSFVKVAEGQARHLGGIGVGGGTLLGLSQALLQTQDIEGIIKLAETGRLNHVDLQMGDVVNTPLPGLPLHVTAASFANLSEEVCREDLALGIIHLVIETIGETAILSASSTAIRDFIMIGNLTKLPQCQSIFSMLEALFHVRIQIPDHAEYRTAIGAALIDYD